jgi:hypothetical protein
MYILTNTVLGEPEVSAPLLIGLRKPTTGHDPHPDLPSILTSWDLPKAQLQVTLPASLFSGWFPDQNSVHYKFLVFPNRAQISLS